MTLREASLVSGGAPDGHLEELRRDPIALMRRVRDECGDVGQFDLAGRPVILLSGAQANEYFFRAPDEDLDQAGAYPFMTPIFGEGVVFDASPERRREALHNQALRGDMMRGHAQTIAGEVDRMVAGWAREGEIDLLDWYAEPRQEDLVNRWTWIPFGAGRHRCAGANFAMIQLKAIFSVLLRDWTFELAQPPASYRNDHSKMVVQLARPCVVRYRRRRDAEAAA